MSEHTLTVNCATSVTPEMRKTNAIPPSDDRERAYADGQHGGNGGTEDEEQDEQRERQRDDLGADEVVLEEPVEIVGVRDAAPYTRW